MKIGSGIEKLLGVYIQTDSRVIHKPIFIVFFQNKEIRPRE
jgi:hypothetical protein